MNAFGQFLDDRDDAAAATSAQRDRDGDLMLWLNRGEAPEVRLLSFDKWAKKQLANRLDWTWAGAAKEKRIEQCRVYLERLVLDLWRRGWMLDGRKLAAHLESVLDSIGTYQRAGKVTNFWAYYQAAVNRYVGLNAEELRDEAMRVGAHVGQLLAALKIERPTTSPTLPELVAKRAAEVAGAKEEALREKQARLRAKNARRKADARQPQLF